MKLRTKLVLGFAAVILVMVALGATAFVMFNRVNSNIAAVNQDSLPAVRYSTGVERSALETILEEKNYLLFKTPDIYARAKGKLSQLASNLDEIDKLAQTTHNAELTSRSSGVRKSTTDYGKLYDQAVEALKKNKAEETLMDEKGDIFVEEAAALLKTKKVEFQQASNALAVINNINAWALDMRLNEKTYMLNHEQMALAAIERNITSLLDAYDALEKLNPDETENKQIANARRATQDYAKALAAWIAEYKRDSKSMALADFLKVMNRSGDTVSQMVDDYILTKQAVFEKIGESMFIVTGISQEALGVRFSEKAYIIDRSPNDWETLNIQVQELPKVYASLREMALTADDKSRIDKAAKATDEHLAAVTAWAKNDNALRQIILPKMKQNGEAVITAAQNIQNNAWKGSDEINAVTRSIVATSNWVIFLALGLGILMGAVMAWAITRSITRPINRIISRLDAGSSEVSASSQQLAEGTSQQAASIEETSSSLEAMSSMTKQNADNAGQANQLMAEAGQVIQQANDSMQRLTVSMQQITQASEETQKIVKTIDEIAFQTNLLALNAAVEAARAGEAGAGFAVVADEVRNLAMRAAEAAKNTSNLIEGTVKRVKDGSAIVAQTNEAFQQVAGSASKAAELVSEISAASSEQAQGIGQINTAVGELDKVTQQNASNSEESASAAEAMSAQAEQMRAFVNDLLALVGDDGKAGQAVTGESASEAAEAEQEAASQTTRSKELSPEQIIPLEDKDF